MGGGWAAAVTCAARRGATAHKRACPAWHARLSQGRRGPIQGAPKPANAAPGPPRVAKMQGPLERPCQPWAGPCPARQGVRRRTRVGDCERRERWRRAARRRAGVEEHTPAHSHARLLLPDHRFRARLAGGGLFSRPLTASPAPSSPRASPSAHTLPRAPPSSRAPHAAARGAH